jgi:hypothetical protein
VTSIFSKLFEEDFERAIPVFKHKQVDLALYALDMHYAQYSAVSTAGVGAMPRLLVLWRAQKCTQGELVNQV